MKKRNIALLALLALVLLLVACGNQGESSGEAMDTTTIAQHNRPEGTDYIVVETLYGELYYQAQWDELLLVEQKKEDDILRVNFTAMIRKEKYLLFSLSIGEKVEANIGYIVDAQGRRRGVSAEVYSISENNTLSDSEANRLYAMQEEINFIMQYLQ